MGTAASTEILDDGEPAKILKVISTRHSSTGSQIQRQVISKSVQDIQIPYDFHLDEEFLNSTHIRVCFKEMKGKLEDAIAIPPHAHLIWQFREQIGKGKTESEQTTACVQALRDGFLQLLARVWSNTEGKVENLVPGYDILNRILWMLSDMKLDEIDLSYTKYILPLIIHFLQGDGTDAGFTENLSSPWFTMATKPYMSVLANLASHDHDTVKEHLRELKVKELMVKYKQHERCKLDPVVQFRIIAVLAALITESDDNSSLHLTVEDIDVILNLLKLCVSKQKLDPPAAYHTDRVYRFTVREIVASLNRIAVPVDRNKRLVVEAGALQYYVELMAPLLEEKDGKYEVVRDTIEIENYLACQGLWTLSFNKENTQKILEEPQCVERLRLHANSSVGQTKKAAQGALWELIERERSRAQAPAPARWKSAASPSDVRLLPADIGHIMISYNSASREQAQQIKAELQTTGFKTWMDTDDMIGSTLEAMSAAVEGASLILILFSEKYKNSPNCRSEAEYTFQLGKPFVPIRVQRGYRADGWLGILLGLSVYLDTNKGNFWEEGITRLLSAIVEKLRERGTEVTLGQEVLDKMASHQTKSGQGHSGSRRTTTGTVSTSNHQRVPPVSGSSHFEKASRTSGSVLSWSEEEVSAWLKETGLEKLSSCFRGFAGPDLHELDCMLRASPDSYYTSMRDGWKLDVLQVMRLTRALKTLRIQ